MVDICSGREQSPGEKSECDGEMSHGHKVRKKCGGGEEKR
jgi:hypothetical protein